MLLLWANMDPLILKEPIIFEYQLFLSEMK